MSSQCFTWLHQVRILYEYSILSRCGMSVPTHPTISEACTSLPLTPSVTELSRLFEFKHRLLGLYVLRCCTPNNTLHQNFVLLFLQLKAQMKHSKSSRFFVVRLTAIAARISRLEIPKRISVVKPCDSAQNTWSPQPRNGTVLPDLFYVDRIYSFAKV